jgi:hypothetical protein
VKPARSTVLTVATGYNSAVLSVAWCAVNEFQVLGGDATGQLRLWDIRRAGVLHAFDQHEDGASDTDVPTRCGAFSQQRAHLRYNHGIEMSALCLPGAAFVKRLDEGLHFASTSRRPVFVQRER